MTRPSLNSSGNPSAARTTLTLPAAQTAAASASTSTAGNEQAASTTRSVRRRLTGHNQAAASTSAAGAPTFALGSVGAAAPNINPIIFLGDVRTLTVDLNTLADAPSTSTGTAASNVRLRRPATAARPAMQVGVPDTTTDESGDISLRPTTAAIAALPTLFAQQTNLLAQQQLQQQPEE